MLTYDRYDILFQEIPDEVSLSFTIEGCPNRCKGCHSPHLREQNGEELTSELFLDIIQKQVGLATCVLFLGGDGFHKEISELLPLAKKEGFKTAIYSGNDTLDGELVEHLNYYKVGSYQESLGGLDSKTTNQRLYKIEDITKKFWND